MSTTIAAAIPAGTLDNSRAYCRELTRRAARNFYFGLKLLPEPKRSAMYALYAYMRLTDDIADDEDQRSLAERQHDLSAWRDQTHLALTGEPAALRKGPVWPAFADAVLGYRIPRSVFDDMIEGQRQDLAPQPMATFDELHQYCYRVASVVGVASIYVWGFTGGEATRKLAIDRGIAFQLTNVLRDLREDAGRGRCYLPVDEMQRHQVTAEDIAQGRATDGLRALLDEQVKRAESYYQRSAPLVGKIAEDSRPTLVAMTEIYHGILERIARDPLQVLSRRVSLSTFAKVAIAWRAMRRK